MVYSVHKPVAPEPLPPTLPAGTQTVLFTEEGSGVSFRWTLRGEATLMGSWEYQGDWRCEGRKGTSFVRYTIVDWGQVRAAAYVDPKTGVSVSELECKNP